MSVDEIRRLAAENIFVEVADKRDIGEGEVCDYSYEKKSEINAALLAYAEIVERCEAVLKANSKDLKYRHRDADAALAYANYILKGARK